MDSLDKRFKEELDQQDLRFIAAFDKHINGIVQIAERYNPNSAAEIEKYFSSVQDIYTKRLFKTFKSHAKICYNMGRTHGHIEVLKFRPTNTRKMASLPQESLDMFVVPERAIQAIDKRQMILAGDVTADMIADIKRLMRDKLYGAISAPEVESGIAQILKTAKDRGSLIATTESTYYYNRGRISSFKEDGVVYVQFSAVLDGKTSDQCRSRHGLVMRLDDPQMAYNIPPLHGRCRSILRPFFGDARADMLDWSKVEALPAGWKSAG